MSFVEVGGGRISSRLVVILMLAFSALPANANPAIDDSVWTEILQRYVNDEGMVDYQGLINDRESFDRYVSSLESIGPVSNPELFPTPAHSLAYYINAYNAQVVKGVLSRGPEKESVWKGLISGLNFFVRMDITVDGNVTNLKKLEDDVVRAKYKDPRIHAALNCASIGCPRLIREAYTAEMLEKQLDSAVREFLNSEMHVRVDDEKKRVWLSRIFDWYEEDFLDFEKQNGNSGKSKEKKQIDYVNRYRSVEDQIPNTYDVKILKYDKGINHQS